jgi:hypothetical protein
MKTVFAAVIMIRNSNPYILVMYASCLFYLGFCAVGIFKLFSHHWIFRTQWLGEVDERQRISPV